MSTMPTGSKALSLLAALIAFLLVALGSGCAPANNGNKVDAYVANYGVIYPGGSALEGQWIRESVKEHALLVEKLIGWRDSAYPRAALIVLHRDTIELADALSKKFTQNLGQQPLIAATLGWVWDGEIHLVMDYKLTLGGLTELLIHWNLRAGSSYGQYPAIWDTGDPGHQHPDWRIWWSEEWGLVSRILQSR